MKIDGRVPVIDLTLEKNVQDACLRLIDEGLLRSAHDCSDGGLAVAVSECCFSSLGRDAIGANINLSATGLSHDALMFSESPSRIVISFAAEDLEKVTAEVGDVPFARIGTVGDDMLKVSVDGSQIVSSPVVELEAIWETALEKRLESGRPAVSV